MNEILHWAEYRKLEIVEKSLNMVRGEFCPVYLIIADNINSTSNRLKKAYNNIDIDNF